jgi:hypothetical protein
VKHRRICLYLCVSLMLPTSWGCVRQDPTVQPQQVKGETGASPSVKVRGVLKDHGGACLTGVIGVLFGIYEEKEGGAPIWQEVQNVDADAHGRFVAMVGSTKSEGIPSELFRPEKIYWLGMQALLPGEVEQARLPVVGTSSGLIVRQATRLGIATMTHEPEAAADTTVQPSDQAHPALQNENEPDSSTHRPRRGLRR